MSSFSARFGHNAVSLIETASAFAVGIAFADMITKLITQNQDIDDENVGSIIAFAFVSFLAAILLISLSWWTTKKEQEINDVKKIV